MRRSCINMMGLYGLRIIPHHRRSSMMEKEWIDADEVKRMFPERDRDAHKGNFGHALLIAGKHGMMGAAMLAAGAALRSGCGLVIVHVPADERLAIHLSHPSAIVSLDSGNCFSELPEDMDRYSAVCAGPGLGRSEKTVSALGLLLETGRPLVLDADALNIISAVPSYLEKIPRGSVLTPHAGELRRLLSAASFSFADIFRTHGDNVWRDDAEKTEMVMALAGKTGTVIVSKGAHTMVCSPSGRLRYNPTGNPGMAKGGSGDVLTGFVVGLMARGVSAEDAAAAGVYLHGAAGDRAAEKFGEESMNASDILECLRI